ncbi:hypothetical protein BFW01_g10981 [Lasiodiplodia theobromae]|uniref:Uncharacterized protein n=1 Tax=Lasiodiplodia theobromae TaxID=45133 RepID=A0A8H7IPV8_9PEZI|nr:hypothetical protein BFW01_g10981 [Lasiodiplodia theobromae]
MSQLPGGGGVRSLRAMFESSHPERSASPELRGRSPTPGSPSVRSSESNSRPASKVRASFISVGPFDSPPTSMPGENGVDSPAVESPPSDAIDALRAAAPSEPTGSTLTQRRGSMSLDPSRDSETLEELRHTVSSEAEHRRASVDIKETVPENAVFTGPTNTPFMEIKEDKAMGNFVDNQNNQLNDAKKSGEPGPKEEATTENAQRVLQEAAAGLKRVEVAAEEKKSESANKSSSDATATAPTPPTEELNEDVAIPTEEPTMSQPDKKTAVEDPNAEMKPSDPKEESAVSGGEGLPPPTETLKPLGTEKAAEEAPEPVAEEKTEEKAEEVEPQPETKADAAPEPVPEPAETKPEPALAEESKPSGAKSPAPPATPTSPIASPKSTTSKTSTAKEPAKRASRTSLKSATSSSAAKPRASSRPASERKAHATPPFTKPRPKSPTRPAKLPSHLTQPTAASAAKRDAEKEEKKPAAKPRTTTTPRAPAVAAKTTTAAASKTAAEKKAGSRPSLPAQSTAKRPESRTSRPSVGARAPDDSFLARMMRPTASSANKTHEKKDDVKSPPRRTVSTKSKQTNGSSVAAKAKTKVVEGIDKAKEKIAEKDTEEKQEESSGPKLEPAAPITEKPVEEEQAAEEEGKNTPEEESGETMTQTPAGIEGGVIRPTAGAPHFESPPQIRQPQQLFPDYTTATPTSAPRALRSFSNASSMTAYSSASTAFSASTAATSVYGGSTPTSNSGCTCGSTPSSVCGDIPPLPVKPASAAPRRGRISNLVAFFENNQ